MNGISRSKSTSHNNGVQALWKVYGFSLIAAPLLLGISTFFWRDGEVGRIGGTLQVYAFILWIAAMLGLLALLRPTMPRLGAWGVLLVAFACIGGTNWGTDGVYTESYGIAGADIPKPALFEAMGPTAPFILFLPGLFFPLTLVTLGIALFRTKAVPAWIAILLCIGGIAFPASRVPRIEMVAHLADLLLLIPAAWIGWQMIQEGVDRSSEPELAATRAA